MTLLARLDPRRYLAAGIGWAVFAVVGVAAVVTADLVAGDAERRALTDTKTGLDEYATQVRDALSMQMETRRALLQAVAAGLATGPGASATIQRHDLASVRARFPEFSWLGVADADGRVQVEAGTPTPGAAAEIRAQAANHPGVPVVSDRLARPVSARPASGRVILILVPLDRGSDGEGRLLAAELPWPWIERLHDRMRDAFDPANPLDVLVTSRDAVVLVGPAAWLGRVLRNDTDASEGGRYVVGRRSTLRLADGVGLGWTAFVRERSEQALAPVKALRNTVFLTIALAGLLSAAIAVGVTQWLTRRLRQLAAQAEEVRRGERLSLGPPAGDDEVGRIGATMAQLIDHLQREKQALLDLNRDLDRRVAERTHRIERMADEARHAAVTRERLRIARDLHDTLAHSLMALLTQIRLIRKLRQRMDASDLEAELTRAEQVASGGLADARSAIRQIRGAGVRDSGLGPAIEELARRCTDRSGVAVEVRADGTVAAWADERAEADYRIVEEALRNVERHAQASRVEMTLAADPAPTAAHDPERVQAAEKPIRVEVVDDGLGFDPSLPQPGHFGLVGMREQAALIGAVLDVRSAPGRGTRIALRVPVAA